jgi:hypothetical protein
MPLPFQGISLCGEIAVSGYNIGELQSLARQDIIQVILSNVFRKSDFETIFETISVSFGQWDPQGNSFIKFKKKEPTGKPCRIRFFIT